MSTSRGRRDQRPGKSATVLAWMFALVVFLVAGAASGATNEVVAATNVQDVVITAERIEYAFEKNVLKAVGNVKIVRGSELLTADRVTARTSTEEVWATGNVVFQQGTNAWRGGRLYCNFDTGKVVGEGQSSFYSAPFYVVAENIQRTESERFKGRNAIVTTCQLPYPHQHYFIKASEASFVPGGDMLAKNVTVHLGGVPVMYLPFWRTSEQGRRLIVRPGYSSRMGAYLLTSYGYDITNGISGRTHLDYRTRRGLAVGQDLGWDTGGHDGKLTAYFADDQDPQDDEDEVLGKSIQRSRYRVLLEDRKSLGPGTYALSRIHYWSDPDVLDDFFRSEYRHEPWPENYVSLRHRSDNYTAGLTVRSRLNNFYPAINRLPEASVEVPMQPVADTPLYYEGHVSASYLEKRVASGAAGAEPETARIDNMNMVSAGLKIGVLNVVPRVGYRATYYSTMPSGGGDTRSLFELGTELSFKAFKLFPGTEQDGDPDQPAGHRVAGSGARHVIEPYMNYTLVPEPNLLPSDLDSYDGVDRLTESHIVRLGVRNKVQVKRDGRPYDLLDLDTWTDGDLDAGEGEHTFDTLNLDAEVRLLNGIALDVDGQLGLHDGELRQANTHLVLGSRESTFADIEHRYRRDRSNIMAGDFQHRFSGEWAFMYDVRYEFENSRLEEHNFWIRREYDCMFWAIGVGHLPGYEVSAGIDREEEYNVMFRLWLKAFPEMGLDMK